jgi:serralysin
VTTTVILDTDSTTGVFFTTSDRIVVVQAVYTTTNASTFDLFDNVTNFSMVFDGGSVLNNFGTGAAIAALSSLSIEVGATSSLVSNGSVITGDGDTQITLTNFGLIQAGASGISSGLTSGTNQIRNYGEISGATGYFVNTGSSVIDNHGTIRSALSSGLALDLGGVDTINNYGTVFGRTSLFTGADTLFNRGTMRGDTAIQGQGGNKTIVNTGVIQSTLSGGLAIDLSLSGTGDDSIINSGTILGLVNLAAGADTFDSRLGSVAGTVFGGDGNDTIFGSRFNDSLAGGNNDDSLFGGEGSDVLQGGAGFNTVSGGNGNDGYTVSGADTIVEGAGGGVDTVLVFVGTFTLAAGVEVEILSLGSAMTGNEFAQTLNGNSGGATLNGAGGADILNGSSNNDTYVLGAEATGVDTVNDTGGTGDTITSTISRSLASYAAIENLTLLGTAANGTGNALVNLIIGNAAANLLDGGALGDTMRGGASNDTYVVDNLLDTVDEQNNAGAGTADQVNSSISFSLVNSARVLGTLENLTLTGTAASGTGNASANVLTGNAVANTLSGGALNDTLIGGAGIDTLTGGANSDFFVFNAPLSAANRDYVTDFSAPLDTFRLENAVMTKLGAAGALTANKFFAGAAAHDADDRIVYNKATGALIYDSNGNAAGGAIQIATLTTLKPVLTAADFVVI